MKISAYIPNYNDGKTLHRAIGSVIGQAGVVEVVVIDDCSTDGSMEVCERFRHAWPDKFRVVRHPEKSRSWEQAAAGVFGTLVGTHVVSVAADDFLLPEYSEAITRYADQPVVFPSYAVVEPETCRRIRGVKVVAESCIRTAEDVAADMRDRSLPQRETGIASAIRRDCLEWLCSLRYWEAGPWADSVGYAAVALRYGAVYLSDVLAGFEDDPAGYGGREREGDRKFEYAEAAIRLLFEAGVPSDVAVPLLLKRGINIEP